MSRRRGRECAMQMLFQIEMGDVDPAEVEELYWRCHQVSPEARRFAEEIFRKAWSEWSVIDGWIRQCARNWSLERINPVDRNILRMAVGEFLTGASPKAVVIDEAVELARKYGSDRSPEFVNGILDAVLREVERSAV